MAENVPTADFLNTVVVIDCDSHFLILEPVVTDGPDGSEQRMWFSSRARNDFERDAYESRILRQQPDATIVRHRDFYGRVPAGLGLDARIV